MAKCDLWSCVGQCWRADDVDTRLRNQLEVHQARARGVTAEIAALEASKMSAMRASRKDVALACIKERRKKEAQLHKYEQLALFCQNTLDRVSDMAAVNETMAALGDVRRQFGQIRMDELYERFGAAVQDVSESNNTGADIHHMLSSFAAAGGPALDEEDLMKELAALEAEAQLECATPTSAPDAREQQHQQQHSVRMKPPLPVVALPLSRAAAAPASTQRNALADAYAQIGVDVL